MSQKVLKKIFAPKGRPQCIIAENYVATKLVANDIQLIYWKSGN